MILRKQSKNNEKGLISLFSRSSRNELVPVIKNDENLSTFETQGEYDYQINLDEVHKYVCNYLLGKNKNINILEEKIKTLENQKKTQKMSPNEYRSNEKQINDIKKDIEEIKNKIKYNTYISEITNILKNWKIINEENMKIKIGQKQEYSPELIILVRKAIKICTEYCPLIKLTPKNNRKNNTCPECMSGLLIEEEGLLVCTNIKCLAHMIYLSQDETFDDNPKTSINFNNYQNKIIFEKCMDRYEGKQCPNWDVSKNPYWNIEIMKKGVLEYCLNKENSIDPRLVTPLDIYDIFKKLSSKNTNQKYNDYYDDIILFTHYFNGWELPVLGINRILLLQDYDQFYQAYEELKDSERSSAQNCNYILYILIRRRNIPYKRQNFKLPETHTILAKAEDKTQQVFQFLEKKRLEHPNKDNIVPWIFLENI